MTINSKIQNINCCDHIARRVGDIAPSGIRKFFDLLASMDGVISLGIGEPDYPTPYHIREAAISSIENGYTMYTPNSGIPELRQELSKHLKNTYNLDYADSQILITVGVSEAMDLAARALVNPGDEVLIPDPCYVSYSPCVVLAGGVPVMIPTCEEERFEISAEKIEPLITEKTKALLIGYPANPTGTIMPREKLEEIVKLANQHGLIIISDEIYSRLVYDCEHTCIATLPGAYENTVFLGGFSKAYAMTGWRIGYAVGPASIIAAMTKIHQYTIMSVPTMSQVAAVEALRNGETSAAEMVADYNRRRLVMVKGLCDIGLSCFKPQGAFYAFPSIKNTGMTSEDFAHNLLMEEKVAVVPGNAFGRCGEGYVRCCYATSLKELYEALERMERFLKKRGASQAATFQV
ncbi:MAG: aminotransferase class I/II-fold pyridoxal phosphate-dependent enzyme [Dehalococcoidales bacterium]|nr:aminotransferase class I/II-fold pyridoxal phosphate-dependent enzyme [Dehalococcoidales bacterium]MDD3264806.1 aminotransferase class I/II-fold pyridoxal phosphate-dependent enzyme [Dehalococcoidales bacterium]MDD4322251.1 aminotransferase class I/II-fold pyridoxal phosphate-dependent enzyme [Dehalococcoidales bacterium]MDD4794429.1 aminotransferase class I/II-fold pyridoxal phosphate-dependent enzyme [Dehalococcoidales bacterium]MDD5121837.1 aminotransferase class I/II-fold pyridoxal phosp